MKFPKLGKAALIAAVVGWLIFVIGLWLAVLYVACHFIAKYW